MSVHLVGGGVDRAHSAEAFRPFVDAVHQRTGVAPAIISLLLVLEPDDETSVQRFRDTLLAAGASEKSVRVSAITEGEAFSSDSVDGVDGIVVGGGLTPAYLDAFELIAAQVRDAVQHGTPYLGFSAGAAIAPAEALVGGYRIAGVQVAPEDAAEELDELSVRPGLGIVDFSVDVHAAQWGTVGRLIAAVEAGLVKRGAAIDEHTVLSDGKVIGPGRVWWVQSTHDGIEVTTERG